jgi:hypothetical protein
MVEQVGMSERRMDALNQQFGKLDGRVSQLEIDLKAETLRAVSIDNDFKETMKELMYRLDNKNELQEFFTKNWKIIGAFAVVMLGGNLESFINFLQLVSKING